jgi:peptidoglycan/LPS O-acetylase OafA/YrhL
VLAAGLLARGPLAFTGRISYSAYLWHLPVLYLWNRFTVPGWASLPAYLAAVAALSWLSWRFVERRGRAVNAARGAAKGAA